MSTIRIDQLLDVLLQHDASELHLAAGRPPVFRSHGRLRKLRAKALVPGDTVALMKSIAPKRCQQELQKLGRTDFGFAFGDKASFRVAVFNQRSNLSVVLRRVTQ